MPTRSRAERTEERERLRRQAERDLGLPVVLRPVQTPEPAFRGRLSRRRGYLLVEYADRTAGYFWDLDLLRELLDHARAGRQELTVWEGGAEPPEGPA